jgi:hypothetical protein
VAYTFLGTEANYSSALAQTFSNDSFNASAGNISAYLSFYCRGDISGITTGTTLTRGIWIEERDNAGAVQRDCLIKTLQEFSAAGLNSTWKRFVFSFTVTDTDTRKLSIAFIRLFNSGKPAAGENFWIEFKDVQIEKGVVPTSYIPTTTAEVTRPAETLKYFNLGNSTKDKESIFISFTPRGTGLANDGTVRVLHSTDTKNRLLQKGSTATNVTFYANNSDSSGSSTSTSGTYNLDTKYALAYSLKHSSPYIVGYLNGVQTGTPETADDFTDPVWGTYFSLGSTAGGSTQLQGDISKAAKFSRALSASEAAAVNRFLNQ